MLRQLAMFAAVLTLTAFCCGGLTAEEPVSDRWWDRVQIYGMIPLSTEQAEAMNYTVNGLWAGFFNTSPVVPDDKLSPIMFESYQGREEAFVSDVRAAGLKVVGVIPGLAGHPKIVAEWPELEDAVCLDADGKPVYFNPEDNSLFMDGLNPLWWNWHFNQCKRAIDLGVDLITVDEIQGNSLGALMPLDSKYSADAFKRYLKERYSPETLKKRFNLNSVEHIDLTALCLVDDLGALYGGAVDYTYAERARENPLGAELQHFRELKNFEHKKRLFDAIRDYAKAKGRHVAITTNNTVLSGYNINGFWLKGLPYMAIADFTSYENTTNKLLGVNPPLPEGKWVACHKLAHAVNGTRNVAIPNIPTVVDLCDIEGGKPMPNKYLAVLMAEAYANGGATVFYAFGEADLPLWSDCANTADFLLKHRAYYDEPSEIPNAVGLAYLYGEYGEGMRTKKGTYFGLARALAEANIPYDVVFGGGDYYLEDTLSLGQLERFEVVVVPSLLRITDNQRDVLRNFVEQGGTAVVFDKGGFPDETGAGNVVVVPTVDVQDASMDLAAAYYNTNDASWRDQLEALVKDAAGTSLTVDAPGGNVSVYPHWQPAPNRLVLHVINYDHDRETDTMAAKESVRVRLKAPAGLRKDVKATLRSPDREGEQDIPVLFENNMLSLSLTNLRVYDLVVIE